MQFARVHFYLSPHKHHKILKQFLNANIQQHAMWRDPLSLLQISLFFWGLRPEQSLDLSYCIHSSKVCVHYLLGIYYAQSCHFICFFKIKSILCIGHRWPMLLFFKFYKIIFSMQYENFMQTDYYYMYYNYNKSEYILSHYKDTFMFGLTVNYSHYMGRLSLTFHPQLAVILDVSDVEIVYFMNQIDLYNDYRSQGTHPTLWNSCLINQLVPDSVSA